MTLRLDPADGGVREAARLLSAGGLVAFPTETVYGLGADARDGMAVARIYAAKGRPSFNPLIVHVASATAARRLGRLSGDAGRLAQAFWPGPLTLVVPLRPDAGLSRLVTAGLGSVGLRVPQAPLAQELLRAAGCPVAAPSANPSGRTSPTTAAHVLQGLDGRIDAVLDGGRCEVGLESTIVDCTGAPTLLRAGGIPVEAIEACLGGTLARAGSDSGIRAPGMLASHYAPEARLRLDADAPRPGETRLGFGGGPERWTLSASGDLAEAAARLFETLHAMDAAGIERIAVAPIPERGLGLAINDRLRRAAAPRGSGAPGGG